MCSLYLGMISQARKDISADPMRKLFVRAQTKLRIINIELPYYFFWPWNAHQGKVCAAEIIVVLVQQCWSGTGQTALPIAEAEGLRLYCFLHILFLFRVLSLARSCRCWKTIIILEDVPRSKLLYQPHHLHLLILLPSVSNPSYSCYYSYSYSSSSSSSSSSSRPSPSQALLLLKSLSFSCPCPSRVLLFPVKPCSYSSTSSPL